MSLTTGTRIGPYEILSALGSGGMGEVYRARDTKLGRDVALKIISDTFALDPDRIARFKREAQVLASLNHPHIAAIYGFEDSGDTHALVLELVEGETLADRIARGPIPLDEALPIARQIAEALEAAHEQAIIHRDLKPANIKVTPDGVVKVLDFGLAKLTESAGSGQTAAGSAHLSLSPTITSPAMMTGMGVILGTAAYMSPEQAKGRPADKRSDVWAFGCVLFEMLTGKRAFDGEDATDVIAAIVRGEPDWSTLPASVPSSIRALIAGCLQKDRKQRIADISVVRYLLQERGASAAEIPLVVVPPHLRLRIATTALISLAVGAAAAAFAMWLVTVPAAPRVTRFEIVPPAGAALASPNGVHVAVSPDGSTLVFHAELGGVEQLLSRRIGDLEAKPIAGTERAINPFFSPDSSRIGFVSGTQLKTIALNGGSPTVVCDVPGQVQGASWAGDVIVFAQSGSGLFRVPAAGGRAENFARPDTAKGETDYRWPEILPGRDAILYTTYTSGGPRQARISVRRLDSGETRELVQGGNNAHYSPTGHLVYVVSPATIMAVPFDAARLEITGAAAPVLDGIQAKASGVTNVAVAHDGTLLYVRGTQGAFKALGFRWVSRNGKPGDTVAERIQGPRYPRLSPDGRSLAVTLGPPNQGNIWVIDVTGASQPRELTSKGHNVEPTWSADGKTLAFASDRDGQRNMLTIAADGSALEPTRLLTSPDEQVPVAWSPDGHWLLYRQVSPKTRLDLFLLAMADGKSRPWLQTEFDEDEASFSPDGRWVSYVSDQTGRGEVWVRPFPGPGAPIRISADGGREPRWSRNGSELFYQSGRRLLTAEVASREPDLRFMPPRVLFEGGFVPYDANTPSTYDVAPDGRFLMIQEGQRPEPPSLVVVQNWFEELKRLAPPK